MKNILIVGNGRLAHHLKYLLRGKNIPYVNWHRKLNIEILKNQLADADIVWLAISDGAIQKFFEENNQSQSQSWIHSSGALLIEGMIDLHPLMSFSQDFFPADVYEKITWTTTSRLPSLVQELATRLDLKTQVIPIEEKANYHAWCVLAGNGAVFLWQQFNSRMQSLNISQESIQLYREQIHTNMKANLDLALTGPWVRNDDATMNKNLEALSGTHWQPVMQALIDAYRREKDANRT